MVNELVLTNGYFEATPQGLIISGEPTYKAWEDYGHKLHFVEGAIQWLIGDWLNYGERRYGELYAQALDAGANPQAWMNFKWVANAIETSTRCRGLSWSHHREVASLPPDKQTAYLELAVTQSMTVKELHAYIHQSEPSVPRCMSFEDLYDAIRAICEYEDRKGGRGRETIREFVVDCCDGTNYGVLAAKYDLPIK